MSDYIKIMKNISEQSPISCRTRTQLKENPWVPASSRREVFDLEHYENTPDECDGIFEIESTIELGTERYQNPVAFGSLDICNDNNNVGMHSRFLRH